MYFSLSKLMVLSLLLVAPLRAAVVEQLDVEDLTGLADRVVVGEVGAASVVAIDDGRRLVTDSALQVLETLKGSTVPTLIVRSSGGVLGERGQRVPGSAQLRQGDRVLLFLEDRGVDASGKPRCRVVGMAQGLFLLVDDHQGGRQAIQQVTGLATLDRGTVGVRPLLPVPPLSETQLRFRIAAMRSLPPTP